MRDPDEDVCYEILRQKQLDAEYTGPHSVGTFESRRQARLIGDWTNASLTTQIHQKVGVVVPFSKTVDRDPNPRIPLSVPERVPSGNWIWVYIVLAVCLFIAAQWWL